MPKYSQENVRLLDKVCKEFGLPIKNKSFVKNLLISPDTKLLGSGTYGTCYLTTQSSSKWVVKLVPDSVVEVESLHGEITALASLKHVSGVQKLVGVCPEGLAIITEYAGKDLSSTTLHSHSDKKSIFLQIATILRNIHRCGWVHLDIKSQNVCVKRNKTSGQIKVTLIDMGLALPVGQNHCFPTGTQTFHNAPETLNNQPNYPSADYFGLSILINKLLGKNITQLVSRSIIEWLSSASSVDPRNRRPLTQLIMAIKNTTPQPPRAASKSPKA